MGSQSHGTRPRFEKEGVDETPEFEPETTPNTGGRGMYRGKRGKQHWKREVKSGRHKRPDLDSPQ